MTHLEEFKLNIFNEILNGKSPFDLIENMKNLEGFDRDIKLLALKFSRYAERFTDDIRAKKCNDVTERYLNGTATRGELKDAHAAVTRAINDSDHGWAVWAAKESASAAHNKDDAVGVAIDTADAAYDAARAASAYAWSADPDAQDTVLSARDAARADLGVIFLEWLRGLE